MSSGCRILWICPLTAAAVLSAGGGLIAAETPPIPKAAPRFPEVYDRTARPYQRGAFLLPLESSIDRTTRYLCPLLLQEIADADATKSYRRFGLLDADDRGQRRVNTDRPTMYLLPGQVTRQDQPLRQMTFCWFYPPAAPDAALLWRGFRMTISRRGFPVLWEMLSPDPEPRVFYVAKPLEDAARMKFGGPLPGRRFAVEPSLEAQPQIVVARIVGDGPQPMGPIVYLDHAALTMTTLRCRCEPPQVTDFAVTANYRVVTVEKAAALDHHDIPPAVQAQLTKQEPLDALLRLPPGL